MCFCCGYLEMTHPRVIVIGLVEAEDTWGQKMCTLCHQLRGHGNRRGSPWIQWTVTLGGVISKQNSVVEATSFCRVWCKAWVDVPISKPPTTIVNLALLAFSLEAVTVNDLQPWYKLGDIEKKTKNLWLSERLPGHGSSSVLVRPQWNCRWPASFTEVFVISRS